MMSSKRMLSNIHSGLEIPMSICEYLPFSYRENLECSINVKLRKKQQLLFMSSTEFLKDKSNVNIEIIVIKVIKNNYFSYY